MATLKMNTAVCFHSHLLLLSLDVHLKSVCSFYASNFFMHQITEPSCIHALNQAGRQKGASKARTIIVVVVVKIH